MVILFVLLTAWAAVARDRFVVDDDAYSDQVVSNAQKLLHEHKLLSLDTLRRQIHTKGVSLNLSPAAHEKLEMPDLNDRLRESTFAIGTFYKCPECGDYHFSSSTGFVLGEGGVLCTCCHVIMEEEDGVKEGYLIAADSSGHVFPVQSVLAADTDADTCLVRINASGLKPLPLRAGARSGEPVYCLSHPGGYFFMFTQGMIARVNRRRDQASDESTHPATAKSRPVLMLNITAEFAPGSSGAAVVDACGNVLGQVASIADAGEPAPSDGENQTASPSVPIRFCTATEELLHLTNPDLAKENRSPALHPVKKPKPKVRQLTPRIHCPARRQSEDGGGSQLREP